MCFTDKALEEFDYNICILSANVCEKITKILRVANLSRTCCRYTLSKPSPQHQSEPHVCLGGNLSSQNPTPDMKLAIFLMRENMPSIF